MKFIPNAVTRSVAKTAFKTKKVSPQLLFGAGIIAFGTTVVLAAKATLRVEEEVIEPAQKEIFHIEQAGLSQDFEEKGKLEVYVRAIGTLSKLYGPTIIMGGITIACFAQSHRILSKRNTALAAAYTAIDVAFREYRNRVREEIGEEKERNLYHSAREITLVEDTDKGPKKVTATRIGSGTLSPYAVFYCEDNTNKWQATSEYRFLFLRAVQRWANKKLEADGFIFLSDVLMELGLPRTGMSQQVGWLHNAENGDRYVSFGFEDPEREDAFLDFMLADDGIWLDFNVDPGNLAEKI
jgi:hypothetical protein